MAVRRNVLRAVVALVAAAVVVAGYLQVHGDFQRWSDESALDGACDGLLDRNVLRGVLGEGAVEVENEGRGAGLVGCEVDVYDGGTVEIRILDIPQTGKRPDSSSRALRGRSPCRSATGGQGSSEPTRETTQRRISSVPPSTRT